MPTKHWSEFEDVVSFYGQNNYRVQKAGKRRGDKTENSCCDEKTVCWIGKMKWSQLFSRSTEEDWFIFATQYSVFRPLSSPNENACSWMYCFANRENLMERTQMQAHQKLPEKQDLLCWWINFAHEIHRTWQKLLFSVVDTETNTAAELRSPVGN